MIGLILRRYMGEINMDNYLIKTITLEESHESDALGNPYYWSNFLELPLVSDTSDRNIYVAVFEGNQASYANYKTDFAFYFRNGIGIGIACFSVRNNRGDGMSQYTTARSLWASIGTVIKVYKIPAV